MAGTTVPAGGEENRPMTVRVFVDFDGTITRFDVGDTLFERFGGTACTDAVHRYEKGEISAVECFRKECAACGDVPLPELEAFLDSQEIDTTFREFLDFCRSRSCECVILSDGMNYYIERILRRHDLNVSFQSNTLTLVPVEGTRNVRFVPSFPFTDETCDRCAACKRNHMLSVSADEDIIVYVGEGYSDRCPARYADVVFAKDHLLEYCRQESIPFYEYHTFADVRRKLESLLDESSGERRNSLKKRRRAQVACRDVFLGG
jgi:2-hydroxy-3-keto-5-methylthiopentenyl-1-phosphate phosphatase